MLISIWLITVIDWIVFYAVSAIFQPYNGDISIWINLSLILVNNIQSLSFFFLFQTSLFFHVQILFPTVLMDRMIAAGGALLFSLFIVFDTSMMMHKLSPEEYIVASVNLYLDILNLFLHLLRLMGERKWSIVGTQDLIM